MSKSKEREQFIEKFKKEFYEKFKLNLYVWTRKIELPDLHPDFRIEDLERIILARYNYKYFCTHDSFKPKLRLGHYMLYKSVFIKIAFEYFKKVTLIGNYLNMSHAVVIHHVKKINDFIDIDNEKVITLIDEIVKDIDEYDKKLKNGENKTILSDSASQ